MQTYQTEFIQYALECNVLRFGDFRLKSGRQSPYFFNTGLFDSGHKIAQLGQFYAAAMKEQNIEADIIYGPAYKGIPLSVTTAIALDQQYNHDLPFAFNRKETKDHGEGGNLVGAPLKGSVLILDDVISAGTSVRESVDIITSAGAKPAGVLISLDRQEKGTGEISAIAELNCKYGLPVFSIISLDHIIEYLQQDGKNTQVIQAILEYRSQYGC